MSLFRSRSGGSLFRAMALTGFIKFLYKPKETLESKLGNKMSVKYKIQDNKED